MHYENDKWIYFAICAVLVYLTACTPQQYKDLPETEWIGIEDGDTIDMYERRGNKILFQKVCLSE